MSNILSPAIIGLGSPVLDFIADENAANHAAAQHLVAEGYVPDEKNYPAADEFERIHELAEAYEVTGTQVHGGSAANKMCTLHCILKANGAQPKSFYIAAIDRSTPSGKEASQKLESAGLTVLPTDVPGAELACSINFSYMKANGTTGKLPFISAGNTKELMNLEVISEAMDTVESTIDGMPDRFLPVESSQLRKFLPEVVEAHIARGEAMGCKLIVALETSTKDVPKNMKALRALVEKAHIVTGNEREVMALYPPRGTPGISPIADSIAQLREAMRSGNGQEFFITQGGEDILIGGPHTATQCVPVMPVDPNTVRSYTGGGDCSTAAYLAYRMMGHSSKKSAQIASVYGGRNIQMVETRMPETIIQELAVTAKNLYPKQSRTMGAA